MTNVSEPRHANGLARWVAAIGLTTVIAVGAGCNDRSASPEDPPETMPTPRTVSYENGILTIGETRLQQFPQHEVSNLFKPPHEWPAEQEVVIATAGEEGGLPVVSAVVFGGDGVGVPSVDQLVMGAHGMLFEIIPTSIIDRDIESDGRRCRVDLRHGQHSEADPEVTSASGVVIVSIEDSPTYGIHLDGSYLDQIQPLTVEIAEALCPGGAS